MTPQYKTTPRVSIVQRIIPHYRVGFFNAVVNTLAANGINAEIIHGNGQLNQAPNSVGPGLIKNEIWIRNTYPFNGKCAIQDLPSSTYLSDLVVLEFADRCLLNHLITLGRIIASTPKRIAFWTHGSNEPWLNQGLKGAFRSYQRHAADYWLCYTDKTHDALWNVPTSRKKSVNNAIDTFALSRAIEQVQLSRTAKSNSHLIFIGSMRNDKMLDYIFDALDFARRNRIEATISFVGDGPELLRVLEFVRERPWANYLGPLRGTQVAPHLWRACGLIMPGAVGLCALDAIVGETPLLSTYGHGHGPEFEYASHGDNAWICNRSIEQFAIHVTKYLQNNELQQRLQLGCRSRKNHYTIDRMTSLFCAGIQSALGTT